MRIQGNCWHCMGPNFVSARKVDIMLTEEVDVRVNRLVFGE